MLTVAATLSTALPKATLADDVSMSASCQRVVQADVVALNQPFFYNRLGAMAPTGQIFALRGDVVDARGVPLTMNGAAIPGQVSLREDKRPRPLTLRMNAGDCLQITFQNLLDPDRSAVGEGNNLPRDRHAGIVIAGLHLVDGISDSGLAVGANEDNTAAPGETRVYTYRADREGTHLLYDGAVNWGGESIAGSRPHGLFGAVNVQPKGARYLRSKVTHEDLALATIGHTDSGHPIIHYEAVYPDAEPWRSSGRAGRPILEMLTTDNRLVHSDLEAIIVGPNVDGSFPASAYALADNPSLPNRLEPYREFTSVWTDEVKATQAFPGFFDDPELGWTLASVRDAFSINYGTAAIGAEVIANRLGVGPMYDCLGCKYEEFFLSSFTVGDPAMVVDIPANAGLEHLAPGQSPPLGALGPKATRTLYPDDPSNVHHSYIGDFTKFRNVHVGHEHHIFHLHAHQWLFNGNDDNSSYLDSQAVGPGSAYTYEIAFGGSGNRNRTPGDAIYHCHFYPHFAQGMYAHWRNHDVLELGTELDDEGRPMAGSRAYPDGEIIAGTPIPAVVPIPGKPMPPLPGKVEVVAMDSDGDGKADSSQARVIEREINPGFPFFVAGIEETVGQRTTTPPLSLLEDGGLPRHTQLGYSDGGEAESHETRWDFSKVVEKSGAIFYENEGTDLEKVAMAFHAKRFHDTYRPDGTAAKGENGFRTNGAPATPGAPYADPCVDDAAVRLDRRNPRPLFFGGIDYASPFNADNPRTYKSADIQMDMVLNKVGWHFPQQRLRVLNDDVAATLNEQRPPEPMAIRLNTFDCVVYQSTNLIPFQYELDDYQATTPTDVVGAHIHLVKFDVTSSDGAANGWNYESGALSPQETVERVHAIRRFNGCDGLESGDVRDGTTECPLLRAHPRFAQVPEVGDMSMGARTLVYRWFADPIVNRQGKDRTLGTAFFHDHFGPSTHQQTGLYSTVLIQPARSTWVHNETGEPFYTRDDGGPTSWQAAILPGDGSMPYREFLLALADFQHAYQLGRGVDNLGQPRPDFAGAINPPHRDAARPLFPNTVEAQAQCPGGGPRPCPEAVSSADPGTYVVNYRNEPLGLRLFDPDKIGPDGTPGWQADGRPGDLSFAFSSQVSRRIAALNSPLGNTPYPLLTADVGNRDPFTPLVRTLAGDLVKVKVVVGAHEEEHNSSINGVKWLQEPSSPNSGWLNSQVVGLSEQLSFEAPLIPAFRQDGKNADYLWVLNANNDGLWNGLWGLMRAYNQPRRDLYRLPNSRVPLKVGNPSGFDGFCPNNAPLRRFEVHAVAAGDALPPLRDAQGRTLVGANPLGDERGTLVYNSRASMIPGGKTGPLHDPSALMYVLSEDLEIADPDDLDCRADKGGVGNPDCPVRLKPDVSPEPLITRANAGDCIEMTLVNRLPEEIREINGFTTVPAIVDRERRRSGKTSFQLNMLRPSSEVGLHPQLVGYDITRHDGMNVGNNPEQTVSPGERRTYRWYAGSLEVATVNPGKGKEQGQDGRRDLVATPGEFGATALRAADPIKGNEKGLVGALVIQPKGATWVEDAGTRAAATVTPPDGKRYRDFVAVLQPSLNWHYADGTPVPHISTEDGVVNDPKDSGHGAINYRSEPIWYRFGFDPRLDHEAQNEVVDNHRLAHSNQLIGGEDPQTPIFSAEAGMPVRFRVVNPGGNSRNWAFEITGHGWQRQPWSPGTRSHEIGDNPYSQFIGIQQGIGASSHWNFVLKRAGGPFEVPGDYLYRDHGPFGNFKGGWGLFRVTPAGMASAPEQVPTTEPTPTSGGPGNASEQAKQKGNSRK